MLSLRTFYRQASLLYGQTLAISNIVSLLRWFYSQRAVARRCAARFYEVQYFLFFLFCFSTGDIRTRLIRKQAKGRQVGIQCLFVSKK